MPPPLTPPYQEEEKTVPLNGTSGLQYSKFVKKYKDKSKRM